MPNSSWPNTRWGTSPMRRGASSWVRIFLLLVVLLGVMLVSRGVHVDVRVSPPPPVQSQETPSPRPPGSTSLRQTSEDYAALAERVLPTVVSIDAIKVIPGYRYPVPVDPFMPHEEGFISTEQRVPSVGSGVIVRKEGYIVTNHHVVEGVREIRITFSNKKVAPAKLVGSDATSDLAVLKVEGNNLPALPFGESKKMRIGEFVLAFGNPLGMHGSVTHGIVSGKDRKDLGIADYEDYIQTDAAINPGNSGGPLVNLDGELIGINAAILSKSGGSQGIGLAIPAEVVKTVIEELISRGRVERSWLGMFVEPMTPMAARELGLPETRGVLVQGGYRNGPAAKGGFHPYDIILEVDGKAVQDDRELRRSLAQIPVGRTVTFLIWRERRPAELTVKTQARPIDGSGQPARGL